VERQLSSLSDSSLLTRRRGGTAADSATATNAGEAGTLVLPLAETGGSTEGSVAQATVIRLDSMSCVEDALRMEDGSSLASLDFFFLCFSVERFLKINFHEGIA